MLSMLSCGGSLRLRGMYFLLRLIEENVCEHSSPTSFVVAASSVGASRCSAPFWSYPASTAKFASSSEPVPETACIIGDFLLLYHPSFFKTIEDSFISDNSGSCDCSPGEYMSDICTALYHTLKQKSICFFSTLASCSMAFAC